MVRPSGFRFPVSALKTNWLIVSLAALLVFAAGLVVYGSTRPLKRTFYGQVIDLVPKQEDLPPGWTVEYKPIADTPEMKAKVDELLNYDDAVYAVYSKGLQRISVYIAYWTPGKMSQRLVAAHTPDVCWVGAGWRIVEARSGEGVVKPENGNLKPEWQRGNEAKSLELGAGSNSKAVSGELLAGNEGEAVSQERGVRSKAQGSEMNATGSTFDVRDIHATIAGLIGAQCSKLTANSFACLPAEERVMELNGQTEHVLFWHLVGEEPVSYETQKQPPWYATLGDVMRRGINQRQEQFFIRVSGEDLSEARNEIASTEQRKSGVVTYHPMTLLGFSNSGKESNNARCRRQEPVTAQNFPR